MKPLEKLTEEERKDYVQIDEEFEVLAEKRRQYEKAMESLVFSRAWWSNLSILFPWMGWEKSKSLSMKAITPLRKSFFNHTGKNKTV